MTDAYAGESIDDSTRGFLGQTPRAGVTPSWSSRDIVVDHLSADGSWTLLFVSLSFPAGTLWHFLMLFLFALHCFTSWLIMERGVGEKVCMCLAQVTTHDNQFSPSTSVHSQVLGLRSKCHLPLSYLHGPIIENKHLPPQVLRMDPPFFMGRFCLVCGSLDTAVKLWSLGQGTFALLPVSFSTVCAGCFPPISSPHPPFSF